MKKILNNKGMTLVEIILSIGLVSIVMVQVLNLLVDLKDEQVLGQDKTSDLMNRTIIIKTVEEDFMNKSITSINECGNTSSDKLADYTIKSCVKIIFNGTAEASKPRFLITARDRFNTYDYFIYGYGLSSAARIPARNTYEAWKLTSGKYPKTSTSGSYICGFLLNYYSLDPPSASSTSQSNYFQITYPVKVKNSIANTSMTFDLEFLYYFRPNVTIPNHVTIPNNFKGCKDPKKLVY